MNKKFARLSTTVLVVFLLALFAVGVGAAYADGTLVSDNNITPVYVPGNPSCVDLGYAFGYKVDPPNSGTYNIDGYNSVTVVTKDGVYFDWSSTLGMDAVIVKGGPNSNAYVYQPPAESFGDGGLASPINPNNGTPYGLSHIEFCYDYELTVSKTADTTFKRTYQWTIDKSVTPGTLNMFTGDSGSVLYTVAVTKTGYTDSDWAVSGTISVENNTPFDATITGVSDQISGDGSPTPNCGVTFPYVLAAGGTLNCSYSSPLPDGTSRTNTATVTTSGAVGGGSATASITFGDPTTIVNGSINVDDTNGGSWVFNNSGSTSYSKTFSCDADKGQHNNTATIRETGQSDSASVTVNCYGLLVTKDAPTSFTRTYNWTIDKMADQAALTLSIGQTFQVNYTVKVNATYSDSAWAVKGNISVKNPAPINAKLNGVSDVISGGIPATVNCGVTFPYTLPAGGTLDCTYTAALPDASARTNTATATLQNTPSGTTDFTGSAAVDFSKAVVTEVDKCIDVSDTYAGALGTVCYPDVPKTFTYSRWIGPYSECGSYTVDNTASFVTKDTGATGSDSWTVLVNVPCLGCTLTPGYWKTHSEFGPAPYDATWALLPSGANTLFFLSNQSYYNVLWTAPNGNAYYILAHAYIATQLNILNGADPTAAQTAYNQATVLFQTYTPAQIAALKTSSPIRKVFISLAYTLDQYNNGYIGPGHCTE